MKARKFAVFMLLGMLVLVGLLTGCGSQSNSNSAGDAGASKAVQTASEAAAPASEDEEQAAAETRVYKQQNGKEVTIPVHPKRVVAVEYLGDVLATGAKPIGSVSHLLAALDVYPDLVQGVEDIGDWSANNLEKIVSLEPDLIIAPVYADEGQIEALSKIAPTVVPPYQGLDVFERLQAIGDILGREQEAEAWIADFKIKSEGTKEQLKPYIKEGETAAIFQITGKRFMVYGARNVGHVLYNVLGFVPPEPIKKQIEKDVNFNIADISMEVLPTLASDRIFIVSTSNDSDAEGKLKELTESSIWKSLPAVKNGKVVTLSDKWTQYNSLMLEWQLDDARRLLTP